MRRDADVIVVGAGPAGAATSLLLAEHGLAVITLDRARFPRDKICGEYLSPEAGRVLDRLGVLKALDGAGAVPLAGMRITAPDGTRLQGVYPSTGAFRPYRGHALGVSRTVLDAILADRLRALGVDFREHVRVTDVVRAEGAVAGVRATGEDGAPSILHAPLVIAADGRASVVAQRLGCRRPHRLRRMAVTTYVSGIDGCRDFGEIFIDPPDYAILNPLAPDRVNLSVVVPLEHAAPWSARLAQFLEARVKHMPHLARRLAGARVVAPVQAMGPLAYRVSPPREGGVLLVGDAAGFYDPFTGEGVYTALRSAELAAEVAAHALRTGDVSARGLAPYQRRRAEVFDDKAKVTRALQVLIRHRRLANLAARLLARRAALLDTMLGVIGDYVPARALLKAAFSRA
ncbi:MAG TPA: NAD(P)/FAD-dependent oxidoreductase [Candidatus Limnocylindria bacterium]|nr:NAD(P)/FAD-dependent oxidoreductase [Candidatus Limnocylindria bacterium]